MLMSLTGSSSAKGAAGLLTYCVRCIRKTGR